MKLFPLGNFWIMAIYRLDRNGFRGGLLAYVREDIPLKLIKTELLNREGFFIEINLRNKKWIMDSSVSIKHRNLQCLATEMFKVHLGEALQILHEVFPITEPSTYNLRF